MGLDPSGGDAMTEIRPLRAMAVDLAEARLGGAFGARERRAAERVIADVRRDGDAAVLRSVRTFDDPGARPSDIIADAATLRRAARRVNKEVRAALDLAHERIREFHEKQIPRAFERRDASALVRLVPTPLRRVGALVPRGAVGYPSTALMTGVPARIAGVRELVVASPMAAGRAIDPALAYSLVLVQTDAMFRVGGAAAVAALAYGTPSLARVDKIVGPGNAYTAAAKWLVSADVGIDALQGPSELVVVATEDADAGALALDLLAQAEHGSGAFAALISPSMPLLRAATSALAAQRTPSLTQRISLYHAPSLQRAVAAANDAAPEHVLLAGRRAAALASVVDQAGAVFVGKRSAVAFGDYVAGTNHCLPTGGTARWSSALRVDDFVRWTSHAEIRGPVGRLARAGATIARHEHMRYHAESMEVRS